jgi:hypothetical protein
MVLGLLLGALFSDEIAAWMGWGYLPTITVDTNEGLKAIHDTRANEERVERYMTPEGLSAFRESLGARTPQAN